MIITQTWVLQKNSYGFDGSMILSFKILMFAIFWYPVMGKYLAVYVIYCAKRLSWNSTTLAKLVDNQSEEFFLQEGRDLEVSWTFF